MRSIRRLLTATAVGVAMTAATIAVGPAAASPEDGQGCVGTPTIPAAYVCVISLTPTNAVPTVTTSYVPVGVPSICYFLDCTDPTTVNVPIPGATVNNGDVAVLWYGGQYYPIGVGAAGVIVPIVQSAINLALQTAGGVVTTVNDIVNDLPTTGQILSELRSLYQPYVDMINDIVDGAPTPAELVDEIVSNRYVQTVIEVVQRILDDGPCEPFEYAINNALRKVNPGLTFECGSATT
jgi:hypothetical protein